MLSALCRHVGQVQRGVVYCYRRFFHRTVAVEISCGKQKLFGEFHGFGRVFLHGGFDRDFIMAVSDEVIRQHPVAIRKQERLMVLLPDREICRQIDRKSVV